MPLPLSTRNPELIARVGDAYERARMSAGETARELGNTSLDAVLAADVAQAKEAGTLAGNGGSGLEVITHPETRVAFETALAATEQLFARIGLVAPTAEQLTASGIDLVQLAAQFEQMDPSSMPEIVIAPQLSVGQWKQTFKALHDDQTINQTGRIKNDGLYIADDVAHNWDSLGQSPAGVPTTTTAAGTDPATTWTVRIIPGTDKPSTTNVPHNDPNYLDKPIVHEYLTLQATRLQDPTQEPIDSNTWTWLNGTMNAGSQAPFGIWRSDEGRVRLNWRGVGFSSGILGVRLPGVGVV